MRVLAGVKGASHVFIPPLCTMSSSSTRSASWGAIFDWDGVIIDSSAHHREGWERVARAEARVLPPGHFERGFGMKNEVIIPGILGWTTDAAEIKRLSLRKEAAYRAVVTEMGIEALPGVKTWLTRLRDAGIPCAIGSSTHRANIDLSLELIGLAPFFSTSSRPRMCNAESRTRRFFSPPRRGLGERPRIAWSLRMRSWVSRRRAPEECAAWRWRRPIRRRR